MYTSLSARANLLKCLHYHEGGQAGQEGAINPAVHKPEQSKRFASPINEVRSGYDRSR